MPDTRAIEEELRRLLEDRPLESQNFTTVDGLAAALASLTVTHGYALLDELERLRAEPHWVRIAADHNREGWLCGLCDGTHEHSHPQVKCSRCGMEGLQENWPFSCCGTEPHA